MLKESSCGTISPLVEIVELSPWSPPLLKDQFNHCWGSALKVSNYLVGSTTVCATALTISGIMLAQMQTKNLIQQTITTSSTRVVVVVIPRFPLESTVLGCVLGMMVLALLRRRERKDSLESKLR